MSQPDVLTALRKRTVVEVEIGGVKLHVRSVSAVDRNRMREWAKEPGFNINKRLTEVAAMGVCSADGRLLGTAEELGELDEEVVAKLATAVLEASGLTEKATEDAQGN